VAAEQELPEESDWQTGKLWLRFAGGVQSIGNKRKPQVDNLGLALIIKTQPVRSDQIRHHS